MFQTGVGPEPAMRPSGSVATKPRRASSKSCRSEKGKLSRTPALASRVADSASLGCARATRLDAASVVTSTAGVIHLSTTGAAIVSSLPIFIFNIRPSRQGYGKLEGAIGRRDMRRIAALADSKVYFTSPRPVTSAARPVGHRHEDQHQGDCGDEAEGTGHAVPLRRHPHAEPFAADRHEPDLPEQEADQQSRNRDALDAVERMGVRTHVAHQNERTGPA